MATKTTMTSLPIGFVLLMAAAVRWPTVGGDGRLLERRSRTLSASERVTGDDDRRRWSAVEWRSEEQEKFVLPEYESGDDHRLLLERIVRKKRDAPDPLQNQTFVVSCDYFYSRFWTSFHKFKNSSYPNTSVAPHLLLIIQFGCSTFSEHLN